VRREVRGAACAPTRTGETDKQARGFRAIPRRDKDPERGGSREVNASSRNQG